MRKRQSHWLVLTYYRPCFDFSESVRVNAHNVINIHESSSSLILSAFYIVLSRIHSMIILSVLLIVYFPFFTETLIDQKSTTTSPKTNMHSYMVTKF